MENKITFKKADLTKDGSMLFTLDNQCFTRFYERPSKEISEIADYLKDSEVYIYFSGENEVGYFGYKKINDQESELKVLAVLPEFQGKGIGKQMITHLFDLNTDKTISLATHPENSPAVIFYLKHGFQIIGWKDNYYNDGQPRLLLKKPV